MHTDPPESQPEPQESPQTAGTQPPDVWEQVRIVVRRLGPAGPLALIAASMPVIVGLTVLGSLVWVGPWMQAHRQTGALLYCSCFAALGGVGFMPTHAYSLLGGYAFGFKLGLALALISYLSASLIAYPIARVASGDRVVKLIAEHPKSRAVYDTLLGCGFGKTLLITFLIRLTSSPFAITNMLLATTRVSLVAYVIATVVGMAPRTGALVFIASLWGGTQFTEGLKKGTPWPLTILFTGVTVAVLLFITWLGNRAIERVTASPPRPTEVEPQRRSGRKERT